MYASLKKRAEAMLKPAKKAAVKPPSAQSATPKAAPATATAARGADAARGELSPLEGVMSDGLQYMMDLDKQKYFLLKVRALQRADSRYLPCSQRLQLLHLLHLNRSCCAYASTVLLLSLLLSVPLSVPLSLHFANEEDYLFDDACNVLSLIG